MESWGYITLDIVYGLAGIALTLAILSVFIILLAESGRD